MSEEQTIEIFQVEKNAVEKSGTSGKSNVKKWEIIGGVALFLIALIVGISTYDSPANRLSRQLDLGNRYLEEQNYVQAIVEFDKAIAIDPMNVDAYLGKAQAYEGMGDVDMANQMLEEGYEKTEARDLRSRLVERYLEQATVYVQSADYEGALDVYDRLLELDGENSQVQETVSDCLRSYIEQLIAEGRYDEAKMLIEKYLDKVQGEDFRAYLDKIEELKSDSALLNQTDNMEEVQKADIDNLLECVNEYREEAGLSLLVWDDELAQKAEDSLVNNTIRRGVQIWGPDTAAEVAKSLATDYPDKYIFVAEYSSLGGAVIINKNGFCNWFVSFK